MKVKVLKNVLEINSCISIPERKSESFEGCFGDHFRVLQYQGETNKSKRLSFIECFGDHFCVFQYQGAKSESEFFK